MSLTYSSRRDMANDLPSIKAILEHYGAKIRRDHGETTLKCPFHGDTHNSGAANLDKNLFICFACGIQGNSLQLIARQEGVDIREAKRIAEGITGQVSGEVRGKHLSGGRLPQAKRNSTGSSTSGAIRRSRGA